MSAPRLALLAPALALLVGACPQPTKPRGEGPAGAAAAGEPAPAPPAAAIPPEQWTWTIPRGLSEPPVPEDNPMSAAKVELGHQLFFDKRLSVDGSRSCYSCHQNHLGNADGRVKALGPGDKDLPRNTPTIWNIAYHTAYYWDGRAPTLEKQMIGAWKGGNMAVGDGVDAKAAEIGALPEYKERFRAIFQLSEGEAVTPDHVAKAISAYERTLLCGDTPWDTNTLEAAPLRGWELFRGKGACVTCHTGPNFTDGLYHNVGVGAQQGERDLGRGAITKDEADNDRFRTPTLRGVADTAPYFHDGSVAELRAAVVAMAKGGDRSLTGLDPNFADRGLSDPEIDDIVAFLRTLTCPNNLVVIGDQAVVGI
ncbi:MAG: c-type cytochrome [Nannocystis sp.]|nr:c-type cytochrome [Nannocystis sp.]